MTCNRCLWGFDRADSPMLMRRCDECRKEMGLPPFPALRPDVIEPVYGAGILSEAIPDAEPRSVA